MKRMLCCFIIAALSVSLSARELSFPVGEELVYGGTWNGIPVARGRSTVSEAEFNGKPVIRLRVEIQTYSFFSAVFEVDDLYESLVDPETFLPVRFEKKLSEGRYRCHEITTFDFETLTARYEHQINGKVKEYPIRADTRDIISFMYFLRGEQLRPDSKYQYHVMADEKLYELFIKTKTNEKIDLPDYKEKVPSLRLEPEAMFDDLFVRSGKATVWVSSDPRRVMTFAKVSVPFGRVRTTLQEINGPGSDFWINKKKNANDGK